LGEIKMKRPFARLGALSLLFLLCLAVPAHAQNTAAVARPAASGPFSYDATKETTLNGTISSVITKPTTGMIMGSHLLLATSSGTVDASLGRFAMTGKGAVSVSEGQHVAMTGVMKTINDKQVFLARTVTAGDHVYTIRNEHGLAMTPQARERLSQQAAPKGDKL
jgi:hypothetical protein